MLTTRIREICADCNNGWMSRLEEKVKPLLSRLWEPSYALGRTTISVDEAATLATWATKTAWVRERAGEPRPTPTAQMRQHLTEHQRPPEFTSLWIARHRGKSIFGVYVAQIETTHQDDHWAAGRRRRTLLCAMTFRGLSVFVRTDDGWGVPQMTLPQQSWQKFWPAKQSVQWPPACAATDADVQVVAIQYSGWLRMPDTRTFNRDPNGWQTMRRN